MIGGSGEKKTIPLAAKHFDHLNIIAGFDELPRKVHVVKQNAARRSTAIRRPWRPACWSVWSIDDERRPPT